MHLLFCFVFISIIGFIVFFYCYYFASAQAPQFFCLVLQSDIAANSMVLPTNLPNLAQYNTSLLLNIADAPGLDAWQSTAVGETAPDVGAY